MAVAYFFAMFDTYIMKYYDLKETAMVAKCQPVKLDLLLVNVL